MRLRQGANDDAFDGMTAEEIRRIRGAAAANVTPGLEGLAVPPIADHVKRLAAVTTDPVRAEGKPKRGRRG